MGKLIAAIENALTVYDMCRKNRNQVTHFNIQLALGEERASGFRLVRKSRKPDTSPTKMPFADKLSDLRRVAKEIRRLNLQLKIVNDGVFLKKRPGAFADRPERLSRVTSLKMLDVPKPLWKPPKSA
jgi:hypothetical protein